MFKICKKKTISEIRFSVEKYYQGCYKAKGMTLSVIWIKVYKCSGIHQPFIEEEHFLVVSWTLKPFF